MLYSVFMLALRSVQRNVLRSFLTILGIVIGVSAVITMVTLGNGATQAIKTQISSLGTNLLLVMPGQRGPGRCGAQALHRVALIGAGGAAGVGAVVHRRRTVVGRCSVQPQALARQVAQAVLDPPGAQPCTLCHYRRCRCD